MSHCYQRLPMRLACRGRRCGLRRLGLETLERRACPAVQAFLNAGVLTVVGDEGNNDVAFVSRSDGFVQLVGDGVGHTFEGVKGIVARTGDGDDQIRGKIVLWVRDAETPADTEPLRLELNVGAGDDLVQVDDSGDRATVTEQVRQITIVQDMVVDLGTGKDVLAVELHNTDTVNLNINSADSLDSIDVGLHRDPESVDFVKAAFAGAHLSLGGCENRIAVNVAGFDQVNFGLAAAGGGNTVAFSGIGTDDRYMDDDLPPWCTIGLDFGGGGNLVTLNTQEFRGADLDLHVHRFAPSSASVAIDLGSDNDTVSILSSGVDNVNVDLALGGGDDVVEIAAEGSSNTLLVGERPPSHIAVDLGAGNDKFALRTSDLGNVDLDLTAGDGNDNVHTQNQVRTTALWGLRTHVRLGAGLDLLQSEIEGYGNVDTLVDAGEEDDVVAYKCTGCRSFFVDESGVIRASADLGAGNDRYSFDIDGADEALLDILAGDGDDDVSVHAQAATPAIRLNKFSCSAFVGDGANQLSVETTGFAQVTQVFLGGGGSDKIGIYDRAGLDFEYESKTLHQQIHTGGGDDIVLNDTDGSDEIVSAIDMGSGNDHLIVSHTVDAARVGSVISMSLSLGAGNDVALLDVLGYRLFVVTINTGPVGDGRDVVGAIFRLTADDRLRRIRRMADTGLDLFDLYFAANYDVQMEIQPNYISVMNHSLPLP